MTLIREDLLECADVLLMPVERSEGAPLTGQKPE
jgi:hypothetical protein